jgi:hypothetical protein
MSCPSHFSFPAIPVKEGKADFIDFWHIVANLAWESIWGHFFCNRDIFVRTFVREKNAE